MSEVALVAMKTAHSGLTTLVGVRFRPGFLPQTETARPAITYQLISDVPESAMGVDTGVARARYQLNIWGLTYTSAVATREAVRSAYQRKRGTFGGVVVQDTFYAVAGAIYESSPEDESGMIGEHHLPVDVQMIYQAAA